MKKIIVITLLVLMCGTYAYTFEDITEMGYEGWERYTHQEKICIVVGFCLGEYALGLQMGVAGLVTAEDLHTHMMWTVDVEEIVLAVDLYYERYPEHRQWPLMIIIYKIGKEFENGKSEYKYENQGSYN